MKGKFYNMLFGYLVAAGMFYPALAEAENQEVPAWSYEYLEYLQGEGLLVLPGDYTSLDRRGLAEIVAQGLEKNRRLALATEEITPGEYDSNRIKKERKYLESNIDANFPENTEKNKLMAIRHKLIGSLCGQIAEATTKNDLNRINSLKEIYKEEVSKLEIAILELVDEHLTQRAPYNTLSPEEITSLKQEYSDICILEAEDYVQLQITEAQLKSLEKFPHEGISDRHKEIIAQYLRQLKNLEGWKHKKAYLWQKLLEDNTAGSINYNPPHDMDLALSDLRAEFGRELGELEWFQEERAYNLTIMPVTGLSTYWYNPLYPTNDYMIYNLASPVQGNIFNLDGEARLEYGNYSNIGSRSRFRVRLYPDINIDGNWHFKSMLNFDYKLNGQWYSTKNPLDRWYLEGAEANCLWDIGAFGTNWAEGNIYDSKFTGLRVRNLKGPVKLSLEYGNINHSDYATSIVAEYPIGNGSFEAGWFNFKSAWELGPRNIGMLNYKNRSGKYSFGNMLLYGNGLAGKKTGYIFTIQEEFGNMWEAGGQSLYMKYYYQPANTYYSHTMNGTVDLMHGFKGIGFGYSHSLAEDILLQAEYDILRDLETGNHNNSIWLAVNYMFSTRNK